MDIGPAQVTATDRIDRAIMRKSQRMLDAHFLSLKYDMPDLNIPIEFVRTAV